MRQVFAFLNCYLSAFSRSKCLFHPTQLLCRLLAAFLLLLLVSPSSLSAQSVHYSYDELGRLVGVVDQNGAAARYVYDASGNITSIVRYTASQVAVLSFTPGAGEVGTVVTISGSNFSSDSSQNTVTFNGVTATIQSSSQNQIVAVVPTGASSGLISVTSPLGSASSAHSFKVRAGDGPPTITGLSPGIANFGGTVALTGTNFPSSSAMNLGSVNTVPMTVASVSSSSALNLTVPSSVGSGHIRLQTPKGVAVSSDDLYVPPSPFTSSQVSANQRISSGSTASAAISVVGNIGMFLIDGAVGQQASVLVSGSTYSEPCFLGYSAAITVLKPSGSQLTSGVMCGAIGFLDSFKLPATGTYAVVIDPLNGSTGTAGVTPYIFNDFTGSLTSGSPYPVANNVPGQNARLTLNGISGQQTSVLVTSATYAAPYPCYEGGVSALISVVAPNGTQVGSTTMCDVSGFLDSFTLPASGAYTVTLDPQGATTGTASLTASVFSDQTGALTPGTAFPISLSSPGQNARLTLSGTAGQQGSILVSSATFSPTFPCWEGGTSALITVLKPDGSQLASTNMCDVTGFLDSFTLPTTGTYTVVLDPQGSTTGTASLLASLFNDQTGTITSGATTSISIGSPGQNARLTMSGTVGQQASVVVSNSTLSAACNIGATSALIKVLAPSGSQVASVYMCGTTGFLDSFTLPATGNYTIVFDPQGAVTGTATLAGYLFNDVVATTSSDASYPVTIASPGQNAILSLSGNAGQQASVLVSGSTLSAACNIGAASALIKVLNPDSSQLAAGYMCGSTGNLGSFTLPTTGAYTVIFDPQSFITGNAVILPTAFLPQTAQPTFSVPAGDYSTAQNIALTDFTSGAAIYFTTDGTVPTTSSTLYSGPIAVNLNETIRAIALASGFAASSVASASYTIDVPQLSALSPSAGVPNVTLQISGSHLGATQGTSTVSLNGVAITPISWSDAGITLVVPSGASTGTVAVSIGGSSTNGLVFTVVNPTSGYKRAITIAHTLVPNTDQTDFPLLVSGVYPSLATVGNGGRVNNANGFDIVFTSDTAGQNLLDHEIDSYDPVTGTASFWVRMPTLSHSSDTTIYLFYGMPGISQSQENKVGVWRNSYLSVYHLGNGSTVAPTDSASAGYTLSGSVTASAGQIGGGATFTGDPGTSLTHESVTAYPSGTNTVTLEAWAKFATGGGGWDILGYGANSGTGSRAGFGYDGTNLLVEFQGVAFEGPITPAGVWHHLVGVYGGGTLSTSTDQIYVDGAPLVTTLISGTPAITTSELKIGGIPTVGFCCAFPGAVDEVRISSGTRSADWVGAEYANQSSPSTFYSFGSEQAGTTGVP